MSWILFLLGFFGGGLSTFFFFTFIFLKLHEKLDDLVRKKEERFEEVMKTLQEADPAPASRPQAICQMTRFENDIVGSLAIPVRAALLGDTISVYQIDSSSKTHTNDIVITADHLIGKINTNTVTSSSERISKFHRHTDMTKRSAPVQGRCLSLRQKGDLPVFQEDPVLLLTRRTEALMRKERLSSQRCSDNQQSCLSSCNSRTSDGTNLEDTNAPAHLKQSIEDVTSRNLPGADTERFQSLKGKEEVEEGKKEEKEEEEGEEEKEDGFAQWKGVLLKLPTRREHERWFNLLQATPQSEEWRHYIKRLPHNDVFNLVVARLFFENQRTQGLQKLLFNKVRRKLRKVSNKLPKHMEGSIVLDHLSVGSEIPLISNVSEPRVSINGELDFDFDLLYRGGLSFSLRISIKYHGIQVPDILFQISVLEIASRMRMSIGAPPSAKLWIGSSALPQLRLELTQRVASHEGILNKILKILPDMSAFMTYVVKVKLFEDMVLPNMEDLPMPCLSYTPPSSPRSSSSTDSLLLPNESSPMPSAPNSPRGSATAALEETRDTERTIETPLSTIAGAHTESIISEVPLVLPQSMSRSAPSSDAVGEGFTAFAVTDTRQSPLHRQLADLSGGFLGFGDSGGDPLHIREADDSASGSLVSSMLVPGSSVSEPWQRLEQKSKKALSTFSSKSKGIKKWFKNRFKDKNKIEKDDEDTR